jgi:hypothetical protein
MLKSSRFLTIDAIENGVPGLFNFNKKNRYRQTGGQQNQTPGRQMSFCSTLAPHPSASAHSIASENVVSIAGDSIVEAFEFVKYARRMIP